MTPSASRLPGIIFAGRLFVAGRCPQSTSWRLSPPQRGNLNMPGPSADERIKRFLKRRAQESALAEVARQEHRERERQEHDEREQQHEQIIERIKAKWTADVELIAAILAELQAKLADEDLEVRSRT